MSARKPAKQQPSEFEFSAETLKKAEALRVKYPAERKRSAVIPLLWIVQKQYDNWIPLVAIKRIADYLDMPEIRVFEVATFYTMFNLAPVGKYFVQVCGTTPCMLAGSDEIIKVCQSKIDAHENHVSSDGVFSWLEVECLGACANAPMVQINDDYFEDLTADNFTQILDDLRAGRSVKAGPQNGRFACEPLGGATCLKDYQNNQVGDVNVTAALVGKE